MNTWMLSQDPEKTRSLIEQHRSNPAFIEHMVGSNDEHFALWMLMVDRRLRNACGLTSRDLADFPSYDEYESGSSPAEGARACLEYQDEDCSFLLDA
jgi:hypothetical protein